MLKAQNHRSHGSGGFGAIQDQDYGGIQQFGQFSRAGIPFYIDAVIKSPVAFDNGKGSGGGVLSE